jgi:cytochrome P450
MLNSWACHTSATHFPEPKTWNPKRWISSADEKLLHPTSETSFYAWGSGPRICPGMKFSQVEFCAVLANVLGKVEVGLDVQGKEGEVEWDVEKERIKSVLRDSVADPLLLHVNQPEELRLKIMKRR